MTHLLVRIRPAVPEDIAALRDLYRRSSLWNEGDRDALLAHPDVLLLPDEGVVQGRTRVAVAAGGGIVGFATGVEREDGALELEDLFVDPDWMRRGIGTQLLADLSAEATNRNIARITVIANPHAYAFYRRAGFVHMREVKTRFGPASRMELAVADPGPVAGQSTT